MSGGSQHNPNGRQQLGPSWNPLQALQVASYLARAPQAHLASERGVTWHTPTPPHLYHVPAPASPDALQVMKSAASNSVFRHTATPPDLFRHTPTPPDKHNILRHTPSPGELKSAALPAPEIFAHLAAPREALVRTEELSAYARAGVDLSLSRPLGGIGGGMGGIGGGMGAGMGGGAANGGPLALSVRDAPTINSLIARAPRARVDALLERLAPAEPPAPAPPSVIVGPRAPTPHTDTDDSDAPAPHKRKRKPDRVTRRAPNEPPPPPLHARLTPPPAAPSAPAPAENGAPETIDDIAAMIASEAPAPAPPPPPAELSDDKLASVLAEDEPEEPTPPPPPPVRRRSARLSQGEPPEPPPPVPEPPAAAPEQSPPKQEPPKPVHNFVEVEVQLEKMFAGLEEQPADKAEQPANEEAAPAPAPLTARPRKRRKSGAPRGDKKGARRGARASGKAAKAQRTVEAPPTLAPPAVKDAYDSGSNASSSRSRGPYIQVVGPGASPVSVRVRGGGACEEEAEKRPVSGAVRVRGLASSTLGARYDATRADTRWTCALCGRRGHAAKLGDLFGPYTEAGEELWAHGECALWAGGVLAWRGGVKGLADAARSTAACGNCGAVGAATACAGPRCPLAAHYPCARDGGWLLSDGDMRALCPRCRPPPPLAPPDAQ